MPMQTQRGGGSIAPTHTPPRRRWVVSNTFQPLHPQGRTVIYFMQYFIVINNSATPCRGGSVQSQLLQHTVRQAGEHVRAAGRRVATHTTATVHRRHHLLLQIHHRPVRTSTHSRAHLFFKLPCIKSLG